MTDWDSHPFYNLHPKDEHTRRFLAEACKRVDAEIKQEQQAKRQRESAVLQQFHEQGKRLKVHELIAKIQNINKKGEGGRNGKRH